MLTFEELRQLAARVSCPMFTSLIAAYALQKGLSYLDGTRTSSGFEEHMSFEAFKVFTDILPLSARWKKGTFRKIESTINE